MDTRKLTYSMPFYSFIPVGLGLLMLWILITSFELFGYTTCTTWKSIRSAPAGDVRVIGALKGSIYVQVQDGTTYCNTQNGWNKCNISTFVFSHKDAPLWFNSTFKFIPEDAAATQITRAGNDYSGYSNIALMENGHVWACPYSLDSEIEQLTNSDAGLWLVIPIAIEIGCVVWFFLIFAKFASPTYWDFSGRGTKIK